MSLGSLLLNLKQKYKHGLDVAYYRDFVRPKIFDVQPIVNTIDNSCCELHVLTSSKDWMNLIWSLKSFYFYSKRDYALCIHEDGGIAEKDICTLQSHFPNARIIRRQDADKEIFDFLAGYPRCLELRQNNLLSLKVFDFLYYLQSDRMFLFDSDLIFFSEPKELLDRIENPDYQLNTVNGDVSSAYTVEPEIVKELLGFELIERFNSGFGLIHKESLSLDWIEEFLGLPDAIGHFWRIEQTTYALCSSKFGTELLPPDYDVHIEGDRGSSSMRHYVGAIRHLMYGEGMRQLVKQDFLKRLAV